MRLIDADVLRDKLHELASDDWNQMCRTFWANVYNECADMVDDQPTIEPQKWIPCSEKLPEDGETVLVQFDDGDMDILTFPNIYKRLNRVARMPLPDPWKG